LIQRVNLHGGNLLLLEPKGKVEYVREKGLLVKERLKGNIKKGIESRVKTIRDILHLSNGHTAINEYQLRKELMLQSLRAYVPRVYLGSVTLFRASKRLAGYNNDPDLGWSKLAAGGLESHEIPGYHGSIVTEPRVRILAERLRVCLSQAQESKATKH
jgi:thioesterase domain-containing protein